MNRKEKTAQSEGRTQQFAKVNMIFFITPTYVILSTTVGFPWVLVSQCVWSRSQPDLIFQGPVQDPAKMDIGKIVILRFFFFVQIFTYSLLKNHNESQIKPRIQIHQDIFNREQELCNFFEPKSTIEIFEIPVILSKCQSLINLGYENIMLTLKCW